MCIFDNWLFQNELDEIYKIFEKENNNKSANRCRMTIETCFRVRMDKVKAQGYFCQGGYKMYQYDKQQAISEYNKTLCKGPTAEIILREFLQYHQAENDAIISGDKVIYLYINTLLAIYLSILGLLHKLKISTYSMGEMDERN